MNAIRRFGVPGVRTLAAAVFIYAGLTKIRSSQPLADGIAAFQLLPGMLIIPLALALPLFELGTGLWLLSGWKARTAAFCGLVATAIFLIALVSAAWRGLPVECGCFGERPSASSSAGRLWVAIGRDMLLAGALAAVYLDACRQKRGRLPGSR